jgi:hypothetical protein
MSALNLTHAVLELRLSVVRQGTVACLGLALCVAGSLLWFWELAQARSMDIQNLPAVVQSTAVPAVYVQTSEQNLAAFYGSLGPARHAEQQVKSLFWLAGKSGLSLSQGQYKSAFDQRGQFSTYEIVLPVTGTYGAVWQFASQALTTIPFASLDEISFKRESIEDSRVEARLRFTLHLNSSRSRVP